MPLSTADPLFPVNTTTVDTAAGIDIRLLDSAQAGATDSSQSVRFTHTQDGAERTFDPGNALVTTIADPLTFQGEGWALRLANDMTPTDDTNCNAVLPAQNVVINVRALLNMNGGTNLGGVTTITFRASLWRYDTVANTGVVIDTASQTQTWDTSALGAENNTRKNTAISMTSVPQTEFLANEILLLQIGCEGTTLPDATVGTTNFDVTLDVDDANTNLDLAAGRTLIQVCYIQGTADGIGAANGVPVVIVPTAGTAAGLGAASGLLQADANMTGSASGIATVLGILAARAEMTGISSGVGTALGVPAVIVPTIGTVEIGAGGGGTTIIKKPIYIFGD